MSKPHALTSLPSADALLPDEITTLGYYGDIPWHGTGHYMQRGKPPTGYKKSSIKQTIDIQKVITNRTFAKTHPGGWRLTKDLPTMPVVVQFQPCILTEDKTHARDCIDARYWRLAVNLGAAHWFQCITGRILYATDDAGMHVAMIAAMEFKN